MFQLTNNTFKVPKFSMTTFSECVLVFSNVAKSFETRSLAFPKGGSSGPCVVGMGEKYCWKTTESQLRVVLLQQETTDKHIGKES